MMNEQEYKAVVDYVKNTFWPQRFDIEKVGGVYTKQPFAYSSTGVRTNLRCTVDYNGSELNASFEELVPGEAKPLLDVTMSPKLLGVKVEKELHERMFRYSPEYLMAAISQTVAEHTNDESDKLLYEASEKSRPNTFMYAIDMLENCKMIPHDECDYVHGLTGYNVVIFQNGGKFDIMNAYQFLKNVPLEYTIRDTDDRIAVFDNAQAALETLNIMVPRKYICRDEYMFDISTPLTSRECESLQDFSKQLAQGYDEKEKLARGLEDLVSMLDLSDKDFSNNR